MGWSDAEKEYQKRLAAQAKEREAEQVKQAMAQAKEIREAQAKQAIPDCATTHSGIG